MQQPLEHGPYRHTPNGPDCCARNRPTDQPDTEARPLRFAAGQGQYSGQQDCTIWQSRAVRLRSVPWVGSIVAAVLMSELSKVSRRNGREIATRVGAPP